MELKTFNASLDPARAKLAQIDALVKEAGEHFNEAQAEKAETLLGEFRKLAESTSADALGALLETENEQQAEDQIASDADREADELGDEDTEGAVITLKSGSVFTVKDGVTSKLAPASSTAGCVVAQGDQIQGHDNPMVRKVVKSIEDGINARTANASKVPGPISTVETGEVADKLKGGAIIGLASSEGDTSAHHTDDASRSIAPASGEPVKILTTNTEPQGGKPGNAAVDSLEAGEGNKFTPSPTADARGDEAAIETGRQETDKPVVITEQPGDAGNLIEHPRKSSGIDGDAGAWTEAGRDVSGFPVKKGSPEDVSGE